MYKIWAKYRDQDWEEVDEADNFEDAQYLIGEYRMAFGPGWTIKSVRQ